RPSPTETQREGRPAQPALPILNRDEDLELAGRFAALERDRARLIRTGENLSLEFWQRVLDRRPWRRVPAESPLAVLYELYGPAGPLLAIGVPRGDTLEEVTGSTAAADFQLPAVTAGELGTARPASACSVG